MQEGDIFIGSVSSPHVYEIVEITKNGVYKDCSIKNFWIYSQENKNYYTFEKKRCNTFYKQLKKGFKQVNREELNIYLSSIQKYDGNYYNNKSYTQRISGIPALGLETFYHENFVMVPVEILPLTKFLIIKLNPSKYNITVHDIIFYNEVNSIWDKGENYESCIKAVDQHLESNFKLINHIDPYELIIDAFNIKN